MIQIYLIKVCDARHNVRWHGQFAGMPSTQCVAKVLRQQAVALRLDSVRYDNQSLPVTYRQQPTNSELATLCRMRADMLESDAKALLLSNELYLTHATLNEVYSSQEDE
jgi:hypothetical protein